MEGAGATLLKRPFYRVAHRILRVWWRVAKPRARGVRCVLRREERLLLVRHTYGDREWSLPGGRMRPWEQAEATARREMREELGLELERWSALGSFESRRLGKRETIFYLEAEVPAGELRVDRGEIGEVRWATAREAAALESEVLREAVDAGVLSPA
ncbi:MAG: NUDIX hydrolase [Thermoleophilaceae bacterium]|nr:NUDIX hydrolase [Thermoleophilaceae bacterium]